MDLKTAILKEHSKKQCDLVVRYIGKDSKRFAQLMKLFFEGEYRVMQRAGWPMSYCVRKYPELIQPYFERLIKNLEHKNLHEAVIRNTVRVLEVVDIPKRWQGQVMNICFNYLLSNEAAAAIKAYTLTVLDNLRSKYPEIGPELKLVIEERWPHEKAAFRSRARKILKKL